MLSHILLRVSRPLTLASAMVALTLTLGCGSGTSKSGPSNISGKVTLDGQPVAGSVVFIVDGKEYPNAAGSLIGPGGLYGVPDVPKGEAEILVKAPLGGAGGGLVPLKDKADSGAGSAAAGIPAPAKYGQRNNGLPKLTIKGGPQTHNIELTR